MAQNYGYQNELDFVNLFNNKKLAELDENSQLFLKDVFGDIFSYDEDIICWKNKMNQKADIFIKYKNYIKSISLKCGKSNSIHTENIQDFRLYLEKLGIPYNVIEKYVSYHYGYMKDENGETDFAKQLTSDEYKIFYQNEIDIFNNYINKSRIIVDMIDRFIVRGRNSDYDIDALVCGTVDNYVWIKKHDIYDLILSMKNFNHTSPHIACMTIGPKKRNINRDSKNCRERYLVTIRWNFIRECIVLFNCKL